MMRLLQHIRPAVRSGHPYMVDGIREARVKLNQNESPYDLPEDIKHELLEAFFSISFNRYPLEQPARLQDVLAEYLGHDPEGILIGNGSNELTYTLGLAMIETGTPVVLPRPMFSLYETVVRLYGGTPVFVPPRQDLRFDADALVEAVQRTRPALTVLTTPNNPTGLAMALDEIERIVQAASGFVLVDEAYVEFNIAPSAQTLLDQYPNVLLLRTLSKAFGLAGLRIGYLVGAPEVIRELLKARLPFMVDRLAETVAVTLLKRPALLQERLRHIQASCQALVGALEAMPGVVVVPSQTNFVLFKTSLEPGLLMGRLAESGVLIRNMASYPELPGYLRVNTGTLQENKAFLAALNAALQT